MDIQKFRFKQRINFHVEVEDSARRCMLPKITMQPLVENAIVHGILEKSDKSGTIVVKGRIEHDRLIMTVEDDGVGFQADQTRESGYRGSGYGVQNIAKRLELYCGESDTIRYHSGGGTGTRVTINVPAVYADTML